MIERHDWWAKITKDAKDAHRYILCRGIEVHFYLDWSVSIFSEANRAEIQVWNGVHHTKLEAAKCNNTWSQLENHLYLLSLVYSHGENHRQQETLKFLGVKP